MPSTIISDEFCTHRKAWAAGPACWILPFMLSFSGRHMTDGHLTTDEMRRALPPDWEPAAERLVSCGLLDRTETGFQIHDYLDVNSSRAEILQRRGRTLTRVRRYRHAATTRDQSESAGTERQVGKKTPTRVVGSERATAHPHLIFEFPDSVSDTSNGVTSNESPRNGAVTRPDPNRSEPIRAELNDNKSVAPKKPRPNAAVDAINIVADASGGRLGRIERVTASHAIHFNRALKGVSPEDWKLIGEWLCAGGESYLGTLTYPKILGNAVPWGEAARAWDRTGRGPILNRYTAQPARGKTAPGAVRRGGERAIQWLAGDLDDTSSEDVNPEEGAK